MFHVWIVVGIRSRPKDNWKWQIEQESGKAKSKKSVRHRNLWTKASWGWAWQWESSGVGWKTRRDHRCATTSCSTLPSSQVILCDLDGLWKIREEILCIPSKHHIVDCKRFETRNSKLFFMLAITFHILGRVSQICKYITFLGKYPKYGMTTTRFKSFTATQALTGWKTFKETTIQNRRG